MTVYKNGGAPAVFQSPKCPRWRLFDYDSSPRTATRCQSSMLQGRRKSQEDRTLCVLDVRIPFPGTMGIREVVVGIVAVFDGHNGAEASEMASKLLMEYFVLHTYFLLDAMYSVVSKTSTGKLLHRRDHDHGNLLHRWKEILGWQWHELHSERLQNVFSANFDDSFHLEILKEALLRAIHDIDVRFSEEASRNNIHSGSTATVVLVADDKFLVANIGDSKAFLCSENFQSPKEAKASLLELYRQTERDGSVSVWDREKYRLASSHGLNHFAVKELTRDHHPDREDERTRVEAAGGQVLNWGGLPRVNGQLAITRAIGMKLLQMQKEMQEERAQIQQGMKLLQQMQLELRSERPKEMFIKEHVESVGTSTNGSCSKVMTTEDLTKKMDASEDYLKKINNLKENSFSLDLDHETSELSVFIDRVDLNELTSGIKWLSTSILSLWCTALEGYHLLRGIKKKKPNWKNIMGHQQDNGWACGYYVMKNMFDIIDACIVERFNEIFTDTSSYEKESIDHIRQLWAQFFLQKSGAHSNQNLEQLLTRLYQHHASGARSNQSFQQLLTPLFHIRSGSSSPSPLFHQYDHLIAAQMISTSYQYHSRCLKVSSSYTQDDSNQNSQLIRETYLMTVVKTQSY
ncbi:hypothetical protein KIW84_075546 [Lathyrus oleraceus]|uniref:PPM-type phosphatase domain-containing protein n=1 Tax=Pisum sativum TaxID=3888 RepID=A0A9D4VVI5_PEA|nr:hypothetical protein KIW84_075546 [Pisum sativum]